MSYEEFVKKVHALGDKAGVKIRTENNGDSFIAHADGVTMHGKLSSEDITVTWGVHNEFHSPKQYQPKHKAILKSS